MAVAILGLEKCIKKLGEIGEISLHIPIRDGTYLVRETARRKVRKDTGDLADSITAKPLFGKNYNNGGRVFTSVEYGVYQEFGTVNMRGKPYMRPAINLNKKTIEKGIAKYAKDKMNKISKK